MPKLEVVVVLSAMNELRGSAMSLGLPLETPIKYYPLLLPPNKGKKNRKQ